MSAGPAPRVLVLGFGPFGEVRDNPAARLALEVDGRRVAGLQVVGQEMPVDYARCLSHTREQVERLRPVALVGLGVARNRTEVEVERVGRRRLDPGLSDNAGVRLASLEGPPEVGASGPVEAFARALGAGLSEDAGRYVCNAWLYGAVLAHGAELPVLFVHLPPSGLAADTFLEAVALCWGSQVRVG